MAQKVVVYRNTRGALNSIKWYLKYRNLSYLWSAVLCLVFGHPVPDDGDYPICTRCDNGGEDVCPPGSVTYS